MISVWLLIIQIISWAFEKESFRVFHLNLQKSPISVFKKKTQSWKGQDAGPGFCLCSALLILTSWEESHCKPPSKQGGVQPTCVFSHFLKEDSMGVTFHLPWETWGPWCHYFNKEMVPNVLWQHFINPCIQERRVFPGSPCHQKISGWAWHICV